MADQAAPPAEVPAPQPTAEGAPAPEAVHTSEAEAMQPDAGPSAKLDGDAGAATAEAQQPAAGDVDAAAPAEAQPEGGETSAQAEASGSTDAIMSAGAEAESSTTAVKTEDAGADDGLNTPPLPEEKAPQPAAQLGVPEAAAKTQTRSPSPANADMKPIPTGPKADSAAFRSTDAATRVQKNERDGEAWLTLIEDATARRDIDEIRERYEGFLKVFPNAARQWKAYISLEMSLSHSNFPRVEELFTRCLRTTPSVELWRLYLEYTRRVNPLPPAGGSGSEDGESERDKVRKVIEGAYEFALRFVGQSRDSGEVWREYLVLLKEREATSSWQQGQKMDDIRRAYQRAVAIPLASVEMIWREYDQYENSLNRITAKKFLAERSPAYMTARTALREMRTLTDTLFRPLLPKVPTWCTSPADGPRPAYGNELSHREQAHVEGWKNYLMWEESNPLQLEDLPTLHGRVLMAYRKATMHMRFYPELWFMASRYAESAGRAEEAVSWLKSGMEACPGSFLLHFAFTEQGEAAGQTAECGTMFTNLLNWVHAQIESLQTQLAEKLRKIDEEGERALADAAAKRRDEGAADENVGGDERAETRRQDEGRAARKKLEEEAAKPSIEELKEAAALVWIKYMHFVRRTEGLRPCRAIFGRARKSPHCTWQVYEANALMEYHCSKEVGVATRVFEVALKIFGSDEAFVVRYLDFLISINDDNNARALFERTVGTFEPERARPLWDRWCDYEYSFGDRAAILRLEQRLKEAYPDEPPVKRFVDRNTYMDLDVISTRDLGFQPLLGGASAADRAVAGAARVAPEPEAQAASGKREMNGDAEPAGAKRVRLAEPDASTSEQRGRGASPQPSARPPPPMRPQPGQPMQAGAPQPFQHQPQQPVAPPQPTYVQVHDVIRFFMSVLPTAASFGEPRVQADDVIECLRSSDLPLPGGGGGPGMMPPSAPAGWGMRGRRGGMGRGRR